MLTRTRIAVFAGALAVGSIAACGKKNEGTVVDTTSAGTQTATVTVDTAPLRVSDIQVGKGVGTDMRVANQTTDFGVRDTMYIAVITDGAAKDAKIGTKWTFNGTQVV